MEDFTKNIILPIITIKDDDDKITKAYKSIMKIIIFEVIHEKAWPITHKSLCKVITMRYDEFPVENIDLIDDKISTFHYLFADPSTLSNVVGKLRNGFYNNTSSTNDRIVSKEFRTSRNVAIAAKKLLEQLNCSNLPSEQYMLALATDKHAMQEYLDTNSININNDPINTIKYPEEFNAEYNERLLYPIFKPSASHNNIEKQDSLHKLRVVESNSNWMEGVINIKK
jgi:hypothetical protein